MLNLFDLPSSLLVALFAYPNLIAASPTPTVTQLASTGSGPDYVSACLAASSSYNSASSSWDKEHEYISTTIMDLGGTSYSSVNYIANASTLCDGHPRVTQSNYSTLSTGWLTYAGPVTGKTTILGTYNSIFRAPSPTCSISPSDCDPLWAAYSSSLAVQGPQTTSPPLTTPPCMNQTVASSVASVDSSIYGCGKCTIYGEGVQLVFWPEPTTVSRDMCASTPTANVTHYGPSAVITAYAGKSVGNYSSNTGSASTYATAEGSLQGYNTADGKETVDADGHVFTSGTAYISISKVYAVDRCSKTFGTGVTDAILAMSSQSVLSLRYSQDHFQRLMETDKVTGYPVNYADFRTPIPWSAWNGQNICQGPKDNYMCTVINENYFRPQLAIPPQITELSPDFKDCQLWYNGLWDPPLALQKYSEAAKPTLPAYYSTPTEPASPSSTVPAPTAKATNTVTALPNERPPSYESQSASRSAELSPSASHPAESVPSASHPAQSAPSSRNPAESDSPSGHPAESTPSSGNNGPLTPASPTLPAAKAPVPSNEPWTTTFELEGETYTAIGENKQAVFGTVTCSSGGPAQTLTQGVVVSYGSDGCVFDQSTIVSWEEVQPTNGATTPDADTVIVTITGTSVLTAVQTSDGGVIVAGTYTLTPGADAVTLDNGEVLSAVSDGVVVHSQTTLGVSRTDATSASRSAQQSSSGGSEDNSSTGNGSSATGTNDGGSGTTGAQSATTTPGSGSSLTSAPVLTSFMMVLFVATVLVV